MRATSYRETQPLHFERAKSVGDGPTRSLKYTLPSPLRNVELTGEVPACSNGISLTVNNGPQSSDDDRLRESLNLLSDANSASSPILWAGVVKARVGP